MTKLNRTMRLARADEALLELWGKPLSERDAKICQALCWADIVKDHAGPILRARETAYPFEGSVHTDGALTKFVCDDRLGEFLGTHRLRCLDPFFGRAFCSSKARVLLTLINLVRIGHADCIAAKGFFMFVATERLGREVSEGDERPGELIGANGKGKLIRGPTPFGLFDGLLASTVEEFKLGHLVGELERRGFLRQLSASTHNEKEYVVTRAGEDAGLKRTDVLAADLLIEMGFGSMLSDAAAAVRREQIVGSLH